MSHGANARHEAAGGRAPGMLADHLPMGAFTAGTDGRLRYVNASWCTITGIDATTAIGQRLPELLAEMDRERAEETLEHAATQPGVHRFRSATPDGQRWLEFVFE